MEDIVVTTVYVQFTDKEKTKIGTVLFSEPNKEDWPNAEPIQTDDPRYVKYLADRENSWIYG